MAKPNKATQSSGRLGMLPLFMRGSAVYREAARGAQKFLGPTVLVGAGLALGATSVAFSGCDQEYPLEPTFCDDWCRATLRAGCDQQPENCVRDCELTRASDDCFSLQRDLLDCYGRADDGDFACVETGFQSEIRVNPAVCRPERDALYECEVPDIGSCLFACRRTQEHQLEIVFDEETGRVEFDRLVVDAGPGPHCPALDQPCESICFSIFGLSSAGLAQAGITPEQLPADAGFATNPAATLTCIQETLAACLIGPLPVEVDAGSSPAVPNTETAEASGVESIDDVISRCLKSQ